MCEKNENVTDLGLLLLVDDEEIDNLAQTAHSEMVAKWNFK